MKIRTLYHLESVDMEKNKNKKQPLLPYFTVTTNMVVLYGKNAKMYLIYKKRKHLLVKIIFKVISLKF